MIKCCPCSFWDIAKIFQHYLVLASLIHSASLTKSKHEKMKEKLQMVAQADQHFLCQDLQMELKVKNLASSDSRGCDLQKEVMVKVTNLKTREVRLQLGVGRDGGHTPSLCTPSDRQEVFKV